MGILVRAGDLVYTFRFLKLLVTPFEKTDAFEFGIVDEKGNRDKTVKLDTPDKKSAYTPFHRLVFNIRRLMSKVPGGSSKLANYAAALYLIHEKYGVDLDKFFKNQNITSDMLVEETQAWFILEDGKLSHGVYTINTSKVVNSTCDEIVQPKDKIRVHEDCYPVSTIGSINIYSATHINTNQEIYITTGDINK